MPLSPKILFYLLTSVAVILEIIADIFFKKWADQNQTWLFVVGFLVYSIGTGFWGYSLRHENLSKAIIIFTLVNLIVVALLGVFYFQEKLSLPQIIGLVLGIVSIVLLEI